MTDFEKLFQENRVFIFRYLLKLTKDSSLAEELTQETFFRAYINFTALRNREKAPIWLCQIAKNTFYAWRKEQKKLDDPAILETAAAPGSMEDDFLQRELTQEALRCLGQLEEPYRSVFSLRVFGNLSFKDISASFGKSESWARVTFYRAKQKLWEQMR